VITGDAVTNITTKIITLRLRKDWRSFAPNATALLRTCRAINAETRILFFYLNAFMIRLDGLDTRAPATFNEANTTKVFFDSIGQTQLTAIRALGVLVQRVRGTDQRPFYRSVADHTNQIAENVFPLRRLVSRLRPDCVVVCHFRWIGFSLDFHRGGLESVWYVNLRALRQQFDAPGGILPNLGDAPMAQLCRRDLVRALQKILADEE
jgi:hypothetical protein